MAAKKRLIYKELKPGVYIYINKVGYILKEKIEDTFKTYMPGCEDEKDFDFDGQDMDENCEVFCEEDWIVYEENNPDKTLVKTVESFFHRWHTIINNENLYKKII